MDKVETRAEELREAEQAKSQLQIIDNYLGELHEAQQGWLQLQIDNYIAAFLKRALAAMRSRILMFNGTPSDVESY